MSRGEGMCIITFFPMNLRGRDSLQIEQTFVLILPEYYVCPAKENSHYFAIWVTTETIAELRG
jgi:hypothetical protein